MPSKYEYASYSSSTKGGADVGGIFEHADTNNDGVIDRSEFENLVSSYESTGGYDASSLRQAASYNADSNASWSRYGAEVRGVGLYYDPNPEIIRRGAPSGSQTYTQNIRVRFLQPPPVPPPGVS